MVTIYLLLKVFLAFVEIFECIHHAIHLLLPLQSLAVLAAHIARNSIKNALKPVVPRDLPQLLQFEKEEYGMCFDLLELKTGDL